jgi:hypothetical protein
MGATKNESNHHHGWPILLSHEIGNGSDSGGSVLLSTKYCTPCLAEKEYTIPKKYKS